MKRRNFLKGSSAVVAAAASGLMVPGFVRASQRTLVPGPPVETSSGKLRGLLEDGVHVFRGIPYGAPTGADNRFRAPRAARPWTGVLNAFGWGPDAPQGESTTGRETTPDNPYALSANSSSLQTIEDEDCLALNIWTPGPSEAAKRPVMVWLHGGGFVSGSAARAVNDGARLARHGDVVVVSLNHRLNVLGFTYLDHLGDETFAGSGNAGMLDIVLALRWIRENIARFGGDPGNVTVFGFSGGGQKLSTLMAMPSATSLFHRAIVQSGQNPLLLTRDAAAEVTDRLLAHLGVNKGNLSTLRSLPVDRLLAAYRFVWNSPPLQVWGFPARFSPLVDTQVIPDQPMTPRTLALSADIPLIIGNMREEMAGFTLMQDPSADRMTLDALPARLRPYTGVATERLIAGYRKIHPSYTAWDLFTLITADMPTRINSIRIAEQRHALKRAPVFMYRVDWQTPVLGGRMKAPHGLDVPLVFRNFQEDAGLNGGGADAAALSDRISDAWIAFSRTGQPGTPALPWPAYAPDERATMIFDRKTRIEPDPGKAERVLLDAAVEKW